ncbi:MAG: S-layer homology domain-containing protein [Clostridiales bacterium]|nr:S-layer homology domain-containing protein [Clostridiales bacterium]MDY4182280.1 rhodanese-like domain-containing protein [Pseudoflavonifractor sp.]
MKQIRITLRTGRALLAAGMITVFLTGGALAAGKTGAADMEDHWAKAAVEELVARGVIPQPGDGKFRPDEQITLDTFVSWIVNAKYGTGMSEGECLRLAREKGFLDPELESGKGITRNTTAQIVALALGDLFEEEPADESLAQQLKDFASCHACRAYTSQSYVKGIMIGREERVFGGDAMLLRSEGAAIVLRMMDESCRLPPEPDEDAPVLLSADAAKRLLEADSSAILLDVRSEDELADGFIPGSVCIPLAQLKETGGAALECEKSNIIIVYCQGGGRSAQAAELLKEAGYTQVYNLGGIGNWTYELSYPG